MVSESNDYSSGSGEHCTVRTKLRYIIARSLDTQLESYRQLCGSAATAHSFSGHRDDSKSCKVTDTADHVMVEIGTLSHHLHTAKHPSVKRSRGTLPKRFHEATSVFRDVSKYIRTLTQNKEVKSQLALTTITTLGSYVEVLDPHTSIEQLRSLEGKYCTGLKHLCDVQIASWEDAVQSGLSELLREHDFDFIASTAELAHEDGATVSVQYIDLISGFQPLKSRFVYIEMLSEKFDSILADVTQESRTRSDIVQVYESQRNNQSNTNISLKEFDRAQESHNAIAQTYKEVSSCVQKWRTIRNSFIEFETLVWYDASTKLFETPNLIREKYGAPKDCSTTALYTIMAQALHLRFQDTVVKEGQVLFDTVIIAAAEFLTPSHYIRANKMYSNPVYARSRVIVTVPMQKGHNKGVHDATLDDGDSFVEEPICRTIIIESLEPTHDRNGVPYPEALQLSSRMLWNRIGDLPTMVGAQGCMLKRLSQLNVTLSSVFANPWDHGGYFIINGSEKALRIFTHMRCNTLIPFRGRGFRRYGANFSDQAVMFRSKLRSGKYYLNMINYLQNGELVFLLARKSLQFIPVMLILLSLSDVSLIYVFQCLTANTSSSTVMTRMEVLLQHHATKPYGSLIGSDAMCSVLGRLMKEIPREKGNGMLGQVYAFTPLSVTTANTWPKSDLWYGRYILRNFVYPHLNADVPFDADLENDCPESFRLELSKERARKFELLILAVRSLQAFVDGSLSEDNIDALSHQETFTLRNLLVGLFDDCFKRNSRYRSHELAAKIKLDHYNLLKQYDGTSRVPIEIMDEIKTLRPFLNVIHSIFTTGSYVYGESSINSPVFQRLGLTIMCERMNMYRTIEQLRGIHRGKRILDMRSSEVRRCNAQSWGFYCVVHTPDGEACGVQNQLSLSAYITVGLEAETKKCIEECLLPYVSLPDSLLPNERFSLIPVIIEGSIMGYIRDDCMETVTNFLINAKSYEPTLSNVEVVPLRGKNVFPSLLIYTGHGRLMRPVQKISTGRLVNVGTWEQTYLNIAAVYSDIHDASTEYPSTFEFVEPNCAHILSLTASVIPFFEHNCSPRNLFQCGILKQAVGPPLHLAGHRSDTKLYHQYFIQKNVVRTNTFDRYELDVLTPNINAVLAVAAYTGMDLEDALILNRSAVDRGMFCVYQTLSKNIEAGAKGRNRSSDSTTGIWVFHNLKKNGKKACQTLGINGLPYLRPSLESISHRATRNHANMTHSASTPLYVLAKKIRNDNGSHDYIDHVVHVWEELDKGEGGSIHSIAVTNFDGADPTSIQLTVRLQRNPVVGDKFCSRHGQKGTLSLLTSVEDLPFTQSGVSPDVLINPHAFPSRMAVGMMLELMAGKYACAEGVFYDGSPWMKVDSAPISSFEIGDFLTRHGMCRYGRESMVNGITGEEISVDIFTGVGGYQRLRHMVRDKWQVRARTDHVRNRVVSTTGQPEHGRKLHGGVRVGEMERDALISHGASEIVLDRLLNVSDKTRTYICHTCGNILSLFERSNTSLGTWKVCMYCSSKDSTLNPGESSEVSSEQGIKMVDIPQVLRLMVSEMMSIGIRTCIAMKD